MLVLLVPADPLRPPAAGAQKEDRGKTYRYTREIHRPLLASHASPNPLTSPDDDPADIRDPDCVSPSEKGFDVSIFLTIFDGPLLPPFC